MADASYWVGTSPAFDSSSPPYDYGASDEDDDFGDFTCSKFVDNSPANIQQPHSSVQESHSDGQHSHSDVQHSHSDVQHSHSNVQCSPTDLEISYEEQNTTKDVKLNLYEVPSNEKLSFSDNTFNKFPSLSNECQNSSISHEEFLVTDKFDSLNGLDNPDLLVRRHDENERTDVIKETIEGPSSHDFISSSELNFHGDSFHSALKGEDHKNTLEQENSGQIVGNDEVDGFSEEQTSKIALESDSKNDAFDDVSSKGVVSDDNVHDGASMIKDDAYGEDIFFKSYKNDNDDNSIDDFDSISLTEKVISNRKHYSGDEDLTFRVSASNDADNYSLSNSDKFALFPELSEDVDENWADFQEVEVTESIKETAKDGLSVDSLSALDDDDDFGDFSDIPISSSSSNVDAGSHVSANAVVVGCFPVDEVLQKYIETPDDQLDILGDLISAESESDKESRERLMTPGWSKDTRRDVHLSEGVWSSLTDPDESRLSVYQFNESNSNKKLFKTLKIDTRNILHLGNKKQLVPLFASNLGTGVLEPVKEAAVKSKTDLPLVDTNKNTDLSPVNDFPPVEFDWSSSGLTNPLADTGSHFLQLKLSPDKNESQSVFNNPPTSVIKEAAANEPLQRIQNMIKDAGVNNLTLKTKSSDENLSKEASRIIASLPDLSHMNAKVLMFPIK